ncbi:2,3-bisphosphoglycerate-independent phosphoglycerate mutase [Patescibacteria group bacterium]|nr:2,3-bisphosphoglycerate-independent phosphoglycerate mutase [Patescibacteria group bacterium]
MTKVTGPMVLVVLDGWGLEETLEHNGVALAKTPNYDALVKKYPFTTLQASGEDVGLPSGQMGNSEVGHTTIGAGKVIYQDLVRISKDARTGAFSHNDAMAQAFRHAVENDSTLHIIGLLSAGGVHSHEDHFIETLLAAKNAGVKQIVVHPFLDGRDSPKTAGTDSLEKLEKVVEAVDGCAIGSVMGRYYAMDRDTNWDRTDKAFKAIFSGEADHVYDTSVKPSQIIREWYRQEVFDEHMEPMVFQTEQHGVLEVKDHDSIIFTNFRSDRAKQLSIKIGELAEDRDLCFVTMANYGKEIKAIVAYTPEEISQTLGSVVAAAGLVQVRVAETEKYPHATYFLNGGRQEPYEGEEDVLIPSRKVKTHDEAPEMRAREICDAAIERLDKAKFMFINFANPDMVGHTANEPAIVTAIETVDRELGRLVEAVLKRDGALLVIADHGNAERMRDPETGEPHTAHTTNPVPCIFIHTTLHPTLRKGGGLSDIAPTILEAMKLSQPEQMTGQSLFKK